MVLRDINMTITNIAAEAFKQLQNPRVLDVRTHAEVDTEALAGAAHFPLQELNQDIVNQYLSSVGHQAEQPVYLLCAGGPRATRAAQQLQDHIDSPLVIIDGGLNRLKQLGLTPEQGQGKVISLERQVRIAAGLLILIGVILGTWYNPWFYGLSGFVGAGLAFAGITDTCAMGMALARMPWNNKAR
jgi:rhodanese-related sulfurtransferase